MLRNKILTGVLLILAGLWLVACNGGGGDGAVPIGNNPVGPVVTGLPGTGGSTAGLGLGSVSGSIQGEGVLGGVPVFLVADGQAPVLPGPSGSIRADIAGSYYSTVTNASGEFTFPEVVEGTYNVLAQQNRFQSAIERNVQVVRANVITVNLKLTATGNVAGKVVPATGTSVLGVWVFVAGTSYAALADTTGAWQITGLPVGTYTLSFAGQGFAVQTLTAVNVRAGQTTMATDVAMSLGQPFQVMVTGPATLRAGLTAAYDVRFYGAAVGPFTYAWTATAGFFLPANVRTASWSAPLATNVVRLECLVTDARGATGTGQIEVQVVTNANQAPSLHLRGPDKLLVASAARYLAVADDIDGDALSFTWSATAGTFNDVRIQGPLWTAPGTTGAQTLTCAVSDGVATTTRTFTVTVLDPTARPTRIVSNLFLGGSGVDEANSIARDAQGNYFVGGRTESSDGDFAAPFVNYGGFDGFVAKLGPDGKTVIWIKSVGSVGGNENIRRVLPAPDGGVYFYGTTTSSGTGNIPDHPYQAVDKRSNLAVVGKFDAAGNLLWIKMLGHPNAGPTIVHTAPAMIVDDLGDIVVCMQTTWGESFTLQKLKAADGTVTGGPYYGNTCWVDHAALLQLPSSQYLVIRGVYLRYFVLDRTSLSLVTETSASPAPPARVSVNGAIVDAGGGSVIMVASLETGSYETASWDWYIRRSPISDLSTHSWAITASGTREDQPKALKLTSDGNFLVGGHGENLTGWTGKQAWFRKYDLNGNLQWESEWGGTAHDYANDFLALDNEAYIFAGSTSSADGDNIGKPRGANTDAWVMKIAR